WWHHRRRSRPPPAHVHGDGTAAAPRPRPRAPATPPAAGPTAWAPARPRRARGARRRCAGAAAAGPPAAALVPATAAPSRAGCAPSSRHLAGHLPPCAPLAPQPVEQAAGRQLPGGAADLQAQAVDLAGLQRAPCWRDPVLLHALPVLARGALAIG